MGGGTVSSDIRLQTWSEKTFENEIICFINTQMPSPQTLMGQCQHILTIAEGYDNLMYNSPPRLLSQPRRSFTHKNVIIKKIAGDFIQILFTTHHSSKTLTETWYPSLRWYKPFTHYWQLEPVRRCGDSTSSLSRLVSPSKDFTNTVSDKSTSVCLWGSVRFFREWACCAQRCNFLFIDIYQHALRQAFLKFLQKNELWEGREVFNFACCTPLIKEASLISCKLYIRQMWSFSVGSKFLPVRFQHQFVSTQYSTFHNAILQTVFQGKCRHHLLGFNMNFTL